MKRSIVFAAAAAGMLLAAGTAFAAAKPRVEVAFVLDSTGSMGGLIEGAKREDMVHRQQHHRAEADARGEDRADHLSRSR